MRQLFTCIVVMAFCGCKYHVHIEQEKSLASYCDNTFYVDTRVSINNWIGYEISLEDWQFNKVPYDKVDSTMNAQKIIADKLALKLKPCIK